MLGDEVIAAALIDRVLHHCHLVNIHGNSSRVREHMALHRTFRADLEQSAETALPPGQSKAASAKSA